MKTNYFWPMINLSSLRFCLLFLSVLFLFNCSGNKEGSESENDPAEDVPNTPFTRAVKYDTCLFIAHVVKDYDVWKAAFDLAQPIREKHGVEALNVYRELNDSSLALVYTNVTNLNEAKDYITSDNLQQSMQNAGVTDAMDLYWMVNRLRYTSAITDSILMFMSFKVINYDRWEKAFLQDYIDEPTRDFQVRNVMQGIEDNGQIAMIFAVNDHDYVEKMEKNSAFRAKMLASGVISYPITYKLINMPL